MAALGVGSGCRLDRGPFFPASNVLFYVGTFIGERLLYFPSIGYCLLLSLAITHAAGLSQKGDTSATKV